MMINKKYTINLMAVLLLTAFTSLPLTIQAQNNGELFESIRSSDQYSLNKMISNGTDINQADRS
ncbi:MAG: hypothetical protein ACNS64_07635, partial [Candidatus Halalkalibacterium sp. M3_1C_030]